MYPSGSREDCPWAYMDQIEFRQTMNFASSNLTRDTIEPRRVSGRAVFIIEILSVQRNVLDQARGLTANGSRTWFALCTTYSDFQRNPLAAKILFDFAELI